MSNISLLRDVDSIRHEVELLNSECLERAKMRHPNQDEELLELMCMEQSELMSSKLACFQRKETELQKLNCLKNLEEKFETTLSVQKETLGGSDLL